MVLDEVRARHGGGISVPVLLATSKADGSRR
jgi:hypothetical protein